MRVLTISNYYPPFEIGGWGQLTQEVVSGLKGRGHKVRVLTGKHGRQGTRPSEPGVIRGLNLESPNHHYYNPVSTLLLLWRRKENRSLIRDEISSFRPDIIYVNGMWNLSPTIALEAERLLPGRVVYYMAGPWPTDPDPHKHYWQLRARRVWLRPLKQIAGFAVRPWLPKDIRTQLTYPMVLCVSKFMQMYMVKEVRIPEHRTRVVRNGIDLAQFEMRSLDGHPGPLRLLFAGRLSPDKGVHTALEAVSRLNGSIEWTLDIVGSGPPDYEHYLKSLVEEFGLGNQVSFVGRVDRSVMPSILAKHDVFVFPSSWQEPLARAVQEAMATGLVVVGTDTGGTTELLQDGVNGMVFPPGSADQLAEHVRTLSSKPGLRMRLAAAARRTVEEHYSLTRMITEVETCLGECLR